MLREDARRYLRLCHGGRFRRWFNCLLSPGFRAVAIYRFGHWLISQSWPVRFCLKPVFFLLFLHMRSQWGIELNPEATIGQGFVVHHYGGIFVGENAVIGKNVSITSGVIIGLAGRGKRKGTPVIGDDVYIAPGAKIAGKITIGNGARIGANAVVGRDVPPNGLVQVQMLPVVTFDEFYGPIDGRANGGGSTVPQLTEESHEDRRGQDILLGE